jgi:predicted transglutaminase-like cysteine proteinase
MPVKYDIMEKITCQKCGTEKDINQFRKSNGKTCKECVNENSRNYYSLNKSNWREYASKKKEKNKVEKKRKPPATEEEKQERIKRRNRRASLARKAKKQMERTKQRNNNPPRPRQDFEIYCDNETWKTNIPFHSWDCHGFAECSPEELQAAMDLDHFLRGEGSPSNKL